MEKQASRAKREGTWVKDQVKEALTKFEIGCTQNVTLLPGIIVDTVVDKEKIILEYKNPNSFVNYDKVQKERTLELLKNKIYEKLGYTVRNIERGVFKENIND